MARLPALIPHAAIDCPPSGPSPLPPAMHPFAAQVYRLVARVPRGRVTTYGAIARAVGDPRKAREVGWALAATPGDLDIPAHRVVNSRGELSGGWAFGGPEVQRALLEAEGVSFLPDGRIDLKRYLFTPEAGA